jgi:hypothetical protein
MSDVFDGDLLSTGLWNASPATPAATIEELARLADELVPYAGVTHLAASARTLAELRARLPVTRDVVEALVTLPLVVDVTLPDGVVEPRRGSVREVLEQPFIVPEPKIEIRYEPARPLLAYHDSWRWWVW